MTGPVAPGSGKDPTESRGGPAEGGSPSFATGVGAVAVAPLGATTLAGGTTGEGAFGALEQAHRVASRASRSRSFTAGDSHASGKLSSLSRTGLAPVRRSVHRDFWPLGALNGGVAGLP